MADTLSTVTPSGNTLPFPALPPQQQNTQAQLPANPSDSPYTPLDLPQATPPPSPLPDRPQPERSQLGAVSKGGAAAYLVDQGLRGIVEGHQRAVALHTERFNRKMAALSGIEKQEGEQFKKIYAEVGSSKPGMTKDQIMADPRVQAAYQRVQAAFDASQTALKDYLPALKVDKKTGKPKADQRGNFVERMFGGGDPHDAIRGYYDARQQLGPGVMYGLPTQSQLESMYQQRQTEATTAKTAETSAETASATEGMKNELANLQAKQNPTEADKARIDHLRDALSNIGKGILTPIDKVPFKNAMTGQYEQRFMDRETNQIVTEPVPGYTPTVSGKPRVQWFRDSRGKIGSVQMGADNQPDWSTANYDTLPPPGVVNLFASKEHTTNTAFTDANGNRHEVTLMNESHSVIPPGTIPTAETHPTTPAPTPPAETKAASAHATPPATHHAAAATHQGGTGRDIVIGNVGSVAYKNLTKQATDAKKNFNDAATNLKTMLSTAKSAQEGNGPAQVGILSAYLKTIVGGAGSGVRINQAEWKAAQGTRPFLQGVQAKFSPAGYMTGVTLSPSQVDQMVKEVQAKAVALHSTAQSAEKAAQDQLAADIAAGKSSTNQAPKPQSSHLDDEILNLVK